MSAVASAVHEFVRSSFKNTLGAPKTVAKEDAHWQKLAEAGTELNVVIGLCVGHDSLFFQHSRVPTTVLVVKDRVTGHNPVAALYTSRSYYRRLREGAAGDESERED